LRTEEIVTEATKHDSSKLREGVAWSGGFAKKLNESDTGVNELAGLVDDVTHVDRVAALALLSRSIGASDHVPRMERLVLEDLDIVPRTHVILVVDMESFDSIEVFGVGKPIENAIDDDVSVERGGAELLQKLIIRSGHLRYDPLGHLPSRSCRD